MMCCYLNVQFQGQKVKKLVGFPQRKQLRRSTANFSVRISTNFTNQQELHSHLTSVVPLTIASCVSVHGGKADQGTGEPFCFVLL